MSPHHRPQQRLQRLETAPASWASVHFLLFFCIFLFTNIYFYSYLRLVPPPPQQQREWQDSAGARDMIRLEPQVCIILYFYSLTNNYLQLRTTTAIATTTTTTRMAGLKPRFHLQYAVFSWQHHVSTPSMPFQATSPTTANAGQRRPTTANVGQQAQVRYFSFFFSSLRLLFTIYVLELCTPLVFNYLLCNILEYFPNIKPLMCMLWIGDQLWSITINY